jgi:hypothetical protein
MATPVMNRVLAIGAGLVASRVANRVLRRATRRAVGGPILGPIVFFAVSRWALPRVRQLSRTWTERGLNQTTAAGPAPRAGVGPLPGAAVPQGRAGNEGKIRVTRRG